MSVTASSPLTASPGLAWESTRESREDIQVLRGWAVLLVLLHHAGLLPRTSGGYLGVDIFFVISGYVITTLLRREITAGSFSFVGFYARRARRLLPAAYVTLAATIAAAPLFLVGTEMRDFERQVWGALAFSGNIALWLQTGYFESAADLKPLLHTWSLGIEEQFYLLWPLLLAWLPRRWWFAAAVAGAALSLGLCLALNELKPGATFYLLPTRAWELAFGCAGALLPATARDSHRFRRLLRLAFFPALAAVLLLPLARLPFARPGAVEVLVCSATWILLVGAGASGFAVRLRGGRWLGDISYSLYLVHWPLFSFAANAWVTEPPMSTRVLLCGLSLALAALMHAAIENPMRRLSAPPRATLAWAALAALLLGVLVTAVARISAPSTEIAGFRAGNAGLSGRCEFVGSFDAPAECMSSGAARVMLLGDSFAKHWAGGFLASGGSGLVQATKSVCGPLLDVATYQAEGLYNQAWARDCLAFHTSVEAWLAHSPVEIVVLASPFGQYLHDPLLVRADAGGAAAEPNAKARLEFIASELQGTVRRLRALGKKVVVIAPPPSMPGYDIGRCLDLRQQHRSVFGAPRPDCHLPRGEYAKANADMLALLERVSKRADVGVIRPSDVLCSGELCRVDDAGVPLYRDGGHLSIEGSRVLGKRMRLAERIETEAR